MPNPTAMEEGTESQAGSTARPPLAPAARWAQAVALLAILAAGAYLVWRWGFTLDGTAMWLGLPLILAETYGFVMLLLLAFSCWRTTRRTPPPPLAGRRVAVLIATFDEDEDVLRPTVVGALGIRNDVPPEVWVLDDGGRAWVSEMCDQLGARYLSRPAPRAHAKAGNINHALRFVRRRVPGDPRRRPRAAAGAARADARLHGRPRGGGGAGSPVVLQPRLRPPAARTTTHSATSRASSST